MSPQDSIKGLKRIISTINRLDERLDKSNTLKKKNETVN